MDSIWSARRLDRVNDHGDERAARSPSQHHRRYYRRSCRRLGHELLRQDRSSGLQSLQLHRCYHRRMSPDRYRTSIPKSCLDYDITDQTVPSLNLKGASHMRGAFYVIIYRLKKDFTASNAGLFVKSLFTSASLPPIPMCQ